MIEGSEMRLCVGQAGMDSPVSSSAQSAEMSP